MFLDRPPVVSPVPNPRCHLIIDATWFGHDKCLIVYWDKEQQRVQLLRYTHTENSLEISNDLRFLKEAGVVPVSVTSDGGTGIRRAVENVFPNIPHQRCVTHIQRMLRVPIGISTVRQNPRGQNTARAVFCQESKPFHYEVDQPYELWVLLTQ